MTLTNAQADEIRVLSIEGMSQRRIAILLSVSRSTVGNIVSGKWHPRRPLPAEDLLLEDSRSLGQCEMCGRRILLPCLPCYLASCPLPITDDDDDDDDKALTLDLDLGMERGQRYLDVIRKIRTRFNGFSEAIDLNCKDEAEEEDESVLEEQAIQYALLVKEE